MHIRSSLVLLSKIAFAFPTRKKIGDQVLETVETLEREEKEGDRSDLSLMAKSLVTILRKRSATWIDDDKKISGAAVSVSSATLNTASGAKSVAGSSSSGIRSEAKATAVNPKDNSASGLKSDVQPLSTVAKRSDVSTDTKPQSVASKENNSSLKSAVTTGAISGTVKKNEIPSSQKSGGHTDEKSSSGATDGKNTTESEQSSATRQKRGREAEKPPLPPAPLTAASGRIATVPSSSKDSGKQKEVEANNSGQPQNIQNSSSNRERGSSKDKSESSTKPETTHKDSKEEKSLVESKEDNKIIDGSINPVVDSDRKSQLNRSSNADERYI